MNLDSHYLAFARHQRTGSGIVAGKYIFINALLKFLRCEHGLSPGKSLCIYGSGNEGNSRRRAGNWPAMPSGLGMMSPLQHTAGSAHSHAGSRENREADMLLISGQQPQRGRRSRARCSLRVHRRPLTATAAKATREAPGCPLPPRFFLFNTFTPQLPRVTAPGTLNTPFSL